MLNADKLKDQIKQGIESIVIPAIEEMIKVSYPQQSSSGDERAKDMADTFNELVSEPLADIIANAIDSYIKNMAITGTLITSGSPTTHVCSISSMPTPVTNGKVPNTLGVS
jgi:hypothetical protein